MAYWYIDHAATGAGNGTSWADAWTSFGAVNWNSFGAGDTLWVSGGTYTETVLCKRPGASESDRAYIKTGAAHPTLSAGHDGLVTLAGFFQLGDNLGGLCNWLTLDGEKAGAINWRITGSTTHGIGARYDNLVGITIRYLEIDNCGDGDNEHGIRCGACGDNWLIEHCYIHDCFMDCINASSKGTTWGQRVARHNHFKLIDDGMQVGGGWDIYGNIFDGTTANYDPPWNRHPDGIQAVAGYFRIYNNVFFDSGQAIFIETAAPGVYDDMQHIHIWNNLCYTSDGVGGVFVLLRAKLPDDGGNHIWDDIRIWNNTVSNNTTSVGVRFMHSLIAGGEVTVPADGIRIENNILHRGTVEIGVDSPFTSAWASGSWKLRNNLFANVGSGAMTVQFQGTTYSDAAVLNAHADASGNINADPLLVDYASNLRLGAGSPAIGAGIDLSAHFTDDIDGNTRTTWDIGAYAYGALAAPTFITEPSSQSVTEGNTAVMSASASGNPSPTYQWRKNGVNIGGATSATLTITNVQASDAGSYDCVATNSEGSATSNAATLTVTASGLPEDAGRPYAPTNLQLVP